MLFYTTHNNDATILSSLEVCQKPMSLNKRSEKLNVCTTHLSDLISQDKI